MTCFLDFFRCFCCGKNVSDVDAAVLGTLWRLLVAFPSQSGLEPRVGALSDVSIASDGENFGKFPESQNGFKGKTACSFSMKTIR